MACGIVTIQLFVLWKHRIAPWNGIKYIIYFILRPYLRRIIITLHSPLHSFKDLTSPFLNVFNTTKQKSVMEHVDIHTSACCVENVTRKNYKKRNRTKQGNSNNYTNTPGYNSNIPSGTRPVTSNLPARSTAVKSQSK